MSDTENQKQSMGLSVIFMLIYGLGFLVYSAGQLLGVW